MATSTMQAFITDGQRGGSVQTVPIPIPGPGDILVKIHFAAFNPGDYRTIEGNEVVPIPQEGQPCGCDFAGTVVEAKNSTDWKEGQRVAGFVFGTTNYGTETNPVRGAFAEYIAAEPNFVYAVPGNITLRQASTVSLAFATAVVGMYRYLELPEPEQPSTSQQPFLVYGASTSVGQYVVQLGRLSGLRVIAVASTKNHDLIKRLGADVTVDYHDEDWPTQVREATQGRLKHVLDCYGGESSMKCAEALSHTPGDHLVVIQPVSQATKDELRVINEHIRTEGILAASVFGRPLPFTAFDNMGGPTPEDQKLYEKYLRWLPDVLEQGRFTPNPVKDMGALTNVPEAMRLSKGGKVSAEKMVFKVIQGDDS